MSFCKNCEMTIKNTEVKCAVCEAPLHNDCKQQCIQCGVPLCDEHAIKNKWKCSSCLDAMKVVNSMEFISATMFESYLKCPYAFQQEFIVDEKYKTRMDDDEYANKYSKTGQALHNLFEKYSVLDPEQYSYKKMLADYKKMFNEISEDFFEDELDRQTFYERDKQIIKNWIEEEATKPRPLYTEKKHFTNLHPDLPPVRATIDRINGYENDPMNWEVEDYKTGKVYTSNMLKNNMQLPIYALTIQEQYGALPFALKLYFPQHQKYRIFERENDDVYICHVPRGGTYVISLQERLEKMVQIYKQIQRGDFSFNTKNRHFCENFCSVGISGMCDGLTTAWSALKQRSG